jgi:hypothetical protein
MDEEKLVIMICANCGSECWGIPLPENVKVPLDHERICVNCFYTQRGLEELEW